MGIETDANSLTLLRTWFYIIQRCYNPEHNCFPDYGGRGIHVCDRWLSVESFIADVGVRPKGMTLDRIDNDGPYSPDNCRWATQKTQCNNRRSNFRITHDGVTQTAAQWAEQTGIDQSTIRFRIGMGWSAADALTTPVKAPPEHFSISKHKGQYLLRLRNAQRKWRYFGVYETKDDAAHVAETCLSGQAF